VWMAEASDLLGVRLFRHTEQEANGPCPKCGGTDRFIVWVHGKYWCRQCKYSGFWLNNPQEVREKLRQQTAAKRQRAAWAVQANRSAWLPLHEDCLGSAVALELWDREHIDEHAVMKWGLGWARECPVYRESESLSIPVFQSGVLVGLRHRLIPTPETGGKYRPHFPGAKSRLFNADALRSGPAVVVEGEKKVIVLDSHKIRAVGLPGATTGQQALLAFARRKTFSCIVALDPGVERTAYTLACELVEAGCQVRLADFPMKPDDLIVRYGREMVVEVLRQARRV